MVCGSKVASQDQQHISDLSKAIILTSRNTFSMKRWRSLLTGIMTFITIHSKLCLYSQLIARQEPLPAKPAIYLVCGKAKLSNLNAGSKNFSLYVVDTIHQRTFFLAIDSLQCSAEFQFI